MVFDDMIANTLSNKKLIFIAKRISNHIIKNHQYFTFFTWIICVSIFL